MVLPFLAAIGALLTPLGHSRHEAAASPSYGERVIRKMHQHYDGKWYKTLTFRQRTTRYGRPPGTPPRVETWYEAAWFPGKLRIDIAPLDSMTAFLYVGDSSVAFRHGQRASAQQDRNLLITLGFDVYTQAVDVTIAQLQKAGIDLSKGHEDMWQGQPVIVVGALAGDTSASQFWIEKDRDLFVRLIEVHPGSTPGEPPLVFESVFAQYRPAGSGWVAAECVIKTDGRVIQQEEYSDIRTDVRLDPELFDTKTYHRAGWIGGS
jgi:hypothetical protein